MALPLLNPVDVQETIDIGDACSFISADRIAKASVFGNPYPVPQLPLLIEGVTDILTFAYVNNNYAAEVNSLASYLLSLCGQDISKAQRLIGQKTGVVIGTSESANQLITYTKFPQFKVGDAGTVPMGDGDTVLEIIDADVAPGWVYVFVDKLNEGEADTASLSWTSVWEVGKITLTFNQGLAKDALVNISYPVALNLTVPTGTSGSQDLSFYATLNGSETKDLKNIKGQYFIVPANAFEVVQFTLFCVSTTGERMSLVWRGRVNNDAGALTLIESDRTVIGDNPFGDAFVFSPANGGTLIIAESNSFQSIVVTMTGITDKVINCEAKFIFSSSSI